MVQDASKLSAQEKRALLKRLLAQEASETKSAPLSFAQERLWFLAQLEPESPLYCETAAARLNAPIDGGLATQVLNEVVRRHEILRTTFPAGKEGPVQRIAPFTATRVRVVDLRAVNGSHRDEAVQKLAREQSRLAFDLVRGPLLRVTLLLLDRSDSVLVVSMHHITSDGWSFGVLLREIVLLYVALRDKKKASLPDLPIQYADFAQWERERLKEDFLDDQLQYWRRQLSDLPVLELPTDRPRPRTQSRRGATLPFELPAELYRSLRDLSRLERCTLFMTLLAAFQGLLSRYTGQAEIVVGTATSGRDRPELEPLIGFFVNLLALRTDVSNDPSFRELLGRVREVALSAYAHDQVPFAKLVHELQPNRDVSREPLFQVVLNVDRNHMEIPAAAGIGCVPLSIDSGTAKYDLHWFLWEGREKLTGYIQYNVDLFDSSTVARMSSHFETLLEEVVRSPDKRLSQLVLLTEVERHQLLVEWNDSELAEPREPSAPRLFEAWAERTPDAVAVVFENRALSYGELNARGNRLARHLQSLGVRAETPVGICLHRAPEMVLAIVAVLKAGGAYLPLDPTYPKDRLAFMLEDSRSPIVLTERRLLPGLPEHGGLVCLDSVWGSPGSLPEIVPVNGGSDENLAYVIYTSGSTGRPKGVGVTHKGLSNLIRWHRREYGVTASDRATQLASLAFDASVWELWPYLVSGASVHIVDDVTRATPPLLVEWLSAQAVTLAFLPTPLAESVLEARWPREMALRALLTGGDRLHAGPPQGLPFELTNHYGPTESAVVTTCFRVRSSLTTGGAPPIGRPIANVETYVLDRHGNPVPAGVPGELHVGGASLARGYFQRPAMTAERFLPDGFAAAPGTRLYRTGDLVRHLADGNVEFLGRIDHQVKVRGIRIELGEIEYAIAQHPGVREEVVVARKGPHDQPRIVAYVVPQPTAGERLPVNGAAPREALLAELRTFLERRLPPHMVPANFVAIEALPLSANGKVNRAALPAPEDDRMGLQHDFLEPRTPIEKHLAGLFSELLGVERVGVHDDFFELGGHSLLATQLISRVRDRFKVELPLSELFHSSTIAGMSEMIERTDPGLSAPPVEPVAREAELPLSFAQQRLWFLDQLTPGNPFYNVATAVQLTGPLTVAALRRSLGEVVRRHEVLRTTFPMRDGRAAQRIAPPSSFVVAVVDLSALWENHRKTEVYRLGYAEADRPFELASGPLLRATLLRLGAGEHVLLLTVHHVVADGWSLGVLIREAAALYEAFRLEKPTPLPELAVQYADFAHWQRQWLQGDVLERQLSYWREVLADLPVLELPADRPRPEVQSYRGATFSFSISPELSQSVRRLTKAEGVTLFMTLLAAFQALLYRYTARDDIVVGSGIANRNRAEIEGLIGFFVNMLVLRTDLSGDPSFRELLARVREVCLGAYAHQDLPFERLVDELAPERELSREPLFQVVFELQNFPFETLSQPDGLRLRRMDLEGRSAKYDLSLYLWEEGERLSGYFEYSTDLFGVATIQRMLSHYQTILQVVVTQPELRLSELPLVSESERRRLLDWSKHRVLDASTGYGSQTGETDVVPGPERDFEEGVL